MRFIGEKTFFVVLSVVLFSSALVAQTDEAAAKAQALKTFNVYMSFLKKSDYKNAATHILPADLDKFHDILLPFFVQFAASNDAELSGMGQAVTGGKDTLSSQEFFTRFMDFVMQNQQEVAEVISGSTITIRSTVFIPETSSVKINYTMEYGTFSMDAEENLSYSEGAWLLNLKQDPEDYVAAFAKLLEN